MTNQPHGVRSAERLHGSGPEPFEACPDGGRCWHDCPLLPATAEHPEGEGMPCWRVRHATPLTAYGNDWTPQDRARHNTPPAETGMPTQQAENDWHHWRGILSGEITSACLDNGMDEPDACETAAVVLTVLESGGWHILPPGTEQA